MADTETLDKLKGIKDLRYYREEVKREFRPRISEKDVARYLVLKEPDSLVPARMVYFDYLHGDVEGFVHVVGVGNMDSKDCLTHLFYLAKRCLDPEDLQNNMCLRSMPFDYISEYDWLSIK